MVNRQGVSLRLTLLVGLFFCFFWWGSRVVASDLPPGVIVGDENGIQVKADGKYFIEHNEIKPGLTFKKKITISNYSNESDPFDLRLTMKGDAMKGNVNLLEAITVTLTLEGKDIYKGDLAGHATNPEIKLPLHLGKYQVGETKVLEATFKVSSEIPAEQWEKANTADFYWAFYGTKEDEKPIKPKPTPKPKPLPKLLPQTGEEWRFVLMGVVIGVFVVLISLIVVKKRHLTKW